MRLCRNDITLLDGDDVTLIACGVLVSRAIEAAQQLARQGVHARLVERCAGETGAVVTVEEHSIIGGLGCAVAEHLAGTHPVPMERIGLADRFAESGPYAELLDKYGMSVNAIVNATRRVMTRKSGVLETI